jgi:hypothetical protein
MRKLEAKELQVVIDQLVSAGWLPPNQSNTLCWISEYVLEPGGSVYRLKIELDNIEGWELYE